MELQRKPDFEDAYRRFDAWWHGQIIDRPPVTVNVRAERRPKIRPRRYATERQRWLDVEGAIDRQEAWTAVGVYLAEDFPRFEPAVGPEVVATVFGCDLEFSPESSWSKPIVSSCRDILELTPSFDNVYWNNIRAKTDLSLERGRGKWLTQMFDCHTNADLVAALRDPAGMALDIAADLEGVRLACDYVARFYPVLYEDIYNRLAAAGQPCTSWTPFLHRGKANTVQADFIIMISPAMFREAVLPSLMVEFKYLERSVYHLDGPGALRHLDALLAIPKLNAIQWVFGAGNGPSAKWIDVYKRIQAAGKSIQLLADDLNDARAVAEHLKPEGVWFCPGGTYSRRQAEDFIAWAARWAARKA
jgi:hypothetical protein